MKYRLWFAPLAMILTACNTTDPTQLRDVAVSFAANAPTAAAAQLDGGAPAAANALVLTSVEIVLREIQLERTDVFDCSGSDDDGCESFEVGPVLVSVPVDGSVSTQFAVGIPEGSYDEIEFEIHKVSSSDPQDATFLQQHSTFVDKSIRVEGTFNGTTFVFESDLNVEQELDLSPPVELTEAATVSLTIRVGLNGWFRRSDGSLIDPATANKGEQNESEVTGNIKTSIEAFEDEDRDGDDTDES